MSHGKTSLVDAAQAQAGMILSAAILDANHGILLPDGAVLTDASIASLRRRGIEQIAVVAEAPDDAAQQLALAQMQTRLEQLFRRRDEQDEAGKFLQDCLLRYRRNESPP